MRPEDYIGVRGKLYVPVDVAIAATHDNFRRGRAEGAAAGRKRIATSLRHNADNGPGSSIYRFVIRDLADELDPPTRWSESIPPRGGSS